MADWLGLPNRQAMAKLIYGSARHPAPGGPMGRGSARTIWSIFSCHRTALPPHPRVKRHSARRLLHAQLPSESSDDVRRCRTPWHGRETLSDPGVLTLAER